MTGEQPTISAGEARRAARNAGALAAASVVSKAALFGWQIILGPWLGPYDYGIYGTVAALFAIGAIVPNFGMGPIVIRDVARHPERAGKYLTATLYMQTVLALLAYIGVNIVAGAMDSSEAVRAYTALAGTSLIIDILGTMCFDQLLARERMVITSVVEVGHILVRIAVGLLALAAGFSLLGVYAAVILTGIGRAVVLWALLLRAGTRPVWPFDPAIAQPLLFNSAPLALSAFLSLAFQQVDKLMTTQLIGETATGYLTLAFVIIFGVINLLNTTILTATFPLMSRAYGDGNNPLFGFMVEKLSVFTLIINVPIVLTLSLFAAELTVPLFGEAFRPTAGVLQILIWYALFNMVAAVLSRGMIIKNRQRLVLIIRGGGLAANVALNLFLLPRIGVAGAAVASVVAEIVVVAVLILVFRAEGLDWRTVAPRLVRLSLVGAVTVPVMLVLGGVHVLLGIVGGLALYGGGVLLGGVIAPDDWDLLYRLVAAMPGGSFILRYWKRDVALHW